MRQVTCNSCGWVHMAIPREDAKRKTKEFAEYWNKAPIEIKLSFSAWGTKPEDLPEKYDEPEHFGNYLNCFHCGNSYRDFRVAKEGDAPIGCTLQSILDFET